jgi:hypothetical protein
LVWYMKYIHKQWHKYVYFSRADLRREKYLKRKAISHDKWVSSIGQGLNFKAIRALSQGIFVLKKNKNFCTYKEKKVYAKRISCWLGKRRQIWLNVQPTDFIFLENEGSSKMIIRVKKIFKLIFIHLGWLRKG